MAGRIAAATPRHATHRLVLTLVHCRLLCWATDGHSMAVSHATNTRSAAGRATYGKQRTASSEPFACTGTSGRRRSTSGRSTSPKATGTPTPRNVLNGTRRSCPAVLKSTQCSTPSKSTLKWSLLAAASLCRLEHSSTPVAVFHSATVVWHNSIVLRAMF